MKRTDIISILEEMATVLPEISEFGEPWQIVNRTEELVTKIQQRLSTEYKIAYGVAIHKDASVEDGVIIKGPTIISRGCRVGAHSYIRNGVILCEEVNIGPSCELKSSIIFPKTTVAHFNYIGNSLVGSNINIEAGAILANHRNEKLVPTETIQVKIDEKLVDTGVQKFGALVGSGSRIGANAVLAPGTLLPSRSIVQRLQLIDQLQ